MRRITTIIIVLLVAVTTMVAKQFTLVIDAGHGGKDAGAVGAFSKEKDINLKIALAFGHYVEKNCPDVKVIYTRKKDVFLELYERADVANKNHADVFVSVHTNALPSGHISRGVETYSMTLRRSEEKLSAAQRENSVITYEKDYKQHYEGYDSNSAESAIMFEYIHDENMAKSVELAKCIQKSLCAEADRPDKGVKQDNFHVLRRTSMPACLVEVGFISTPDEETLLNNDDALDRMGYGIYRGFVKYKNGNDNDVAEYNPQVVKESTKVEETKPAKVEEAPKAVKQEPVAKQETKAAKQEIKAAKQETKSANSSDAPVFKVQFATAPKIYKDGDSVFKGVTGTSYYQDGKLFKFTIGECSTFAEANKMRREISDRFPDAFVVAFRNGERMDINEARKLVK